MASIATIDYGFAPDGDRARIIDRKARAYLAESIEHIAKQSAGIIPYNVAALTGLIEGLRQGQQYPPGTYGTYFELALCLMDEDYDRAEKLFDALVCDEVISGNFRIVALDSPYITRHRERYLALMDSDPNSSFIMRPPSVAEANGFRTRFEHAWKLLGEAIPALADEFAALVSEVCMVVGDPNARMQFDGGSSYMLWGGLFLNAASHDSEASLIEALAHESAHSLLFGYALDEALVENDDDELFKSPLRVDSRPMDGIYHATYVSARMHWSMSRLIESGRLDATGQAKAEKARAHDRENFEAGYAVVREHGRLSATGRAVMAEARSYMDSLA
jgi:hypothetical protein